MATDEEIAKLKAALERATAADNKAQAEAYDAAQARRATELALLEAQGEGGSLRARWIRALDCGSGEDLDWLNAQMYPEHHLARAAKLAAIKVPYSADGKSV